MDAFTEYVALEVVGGHAERLYTDGVQFSCNAELAAELRQYAEAIILETYAAIGEGHKSLFVQEYIERSFGAVDWDDVADHYADDLVAA